ncbi:MAG: hypothetical protein ABIO94_05905, partial [Opitutaceae bacterium]
MAQPDKIKTTARKAALLTGTRKDENPRGPDRDDEDGKQNMALNAPGTDAERRMALAICRVFETLLFNFGRIFPNDVARAGIDQLETVQHLVAGALRCAGRQTLEFARQEKIRPTKLDDI